MDIFSIFTLFGGLAMFLYGMRLMGDGLKEGSSGTLKKAMESVTNSPIKAFLLGLAITAIIQSSTATIVITSGLVAAGIITFQQSFGIIVGANVGTTVTGQIIRLLDLNTSSTSWLQFFKPSTLAPIALIIGIVLIMFCKFRSSDTIGNIAIGFGILFSGLLNMTSSVDSLSQTGVFESLFARLGSNHLLGYLTGAGVAFILQSASATVGILQAFASTGQLTFNSIYAVLVGIYLGVCVATGIVCSIGAKDDAKRVGVVNILFNLGKTVIILVAVSIIGRLGLLDSIWNKPITSGGIANANTIFNLVCALLLLPMKNIFEQMSYKIVKNDKLPEDKYSEKLKSLNPALVSSPALALDSCFSILGTMFDAARANLKNAAKLLKKYDSDLFEEIHNEEACVDRLADGVSVYLLQLSPHLNTDMLVRILDQYYKDVTEFERLSDHAENIAEMVADLDRNSLTFSDTAMHELSVLYELMDRILDYAEHAFKERDTESAKHIEPLEQAVDDIVGLLKAKHFGRLRKGGCSIGAGTSFLNLLSEIERISDVCSNIGVATLARVYPEVATQSHNYIATLYTSDGFTKEYHAIRDEFMQKLS